LAEVDRLMIEAANIYALLALIAVFDGFLDRIPVDAVLAGLGEMLDTIAAPDLGFWYCHGVLLPGLAARLGT